MVGPYGSTAGAEDNEQRAPAEFITTRGDPTCPVCHSGVEDLEHFLFHCDPSYHARASELLADGLRAAGAVYTASEYSSGSRWTTHDRMRVLLGDSFARTGDAERDRAELPGTVSVQVRYELDGNRAASAAIDRVAKNLLVQLMKRRERIVGRAAIVYHDSGLLIECKPPINSGTTAPAPIVMPTHAIAVVDADADTDVECTHDAIISTGTGSEISTAAECHFNPSINAQRPDTIHKSKLEPNVHRECHSHPMMGALRGSQPANNILECGGVRTRPCTSDQIDSKRSLAPSLAPITVPSTPTKRRVSSSVGWSPSRATPRSHAVHPTTGGSSRAVSQHNSSSSSTHEPNALGVTVPAPAPRVACARRVAMC